MRPPAFSQPDRLRGRFAPSPTGLVHLGNARTALAAWLSVRQRSGTMIWRLEDLDPPREIPGAAEAAMRDLAWLGLDWDEGPDVGGRFGPYTQSQRHQHYEQALRRLAASGRLFPCSKSRRDIHEIASAPHGRAPSPAYPPELRPRHLDPDWFSQFEEDENLEAALRFQVDDGAVLVEDRVFGQQEENVAATVGDFVLKRRDGLIAYQLAVVVDDIMMDVMEVVRGADLLSSTARQIQLIEALGAPRPSYGHIPLVLNHTGEKLSKRDGALTLEALRSAGASPEQVTGYLAWTLGLLPSARTIPAAELIPRFHWEIIPRTEVVLEPDIIDFICSI